MINLDERFEQAWSDEPAAAAPTDFLTTAKRVRRRRRAGAGLATAAVVGVLAGTLGVLSQGDSPAPAPNGAVAEQPSKAPSAPEPSPDGYPVKAWPPAAQGAKGEVQTWIDSDGTIYRTSESVLVLNTTQVVPIFDAKTGEPVGHVEAIVSRQRGVDATLIAELVGGKLVSSYVQKEVTLGQLSDDLDLPRFEMVTADNGHTVFASPVGITGDGQLEPVTDQVEILQQGPAATFSTKRFDAGTPTAGIVEFHDRRYYAIVGYRADQHDVIHTELAHGRSFEEWLAEVKERMDFGVPLG